LGRRDAWRVLPSHQEAGFVAAGADIVDWFQLQGAGYQTRINGVLRDYVERCQKGHG
jgi:uncharacterized protein (DUF4415 family)